MSAIIWKSSQFKILNKIVVLVSDMEADVIKENCLFCFLSKKMNQHIRNVLGDLHVLNRAFVVSFEKFLGEVKKLFVM